MHEYPNHIGIAVDCPELKFLSVSLGESFCTIGPSLLLTPPGVNNDWRENSHVKSD